MRPPSRLLAIAVASILAQLTACSTDDEASAVAETVTPGDDAATGRDRDPVHGRDYFFHHAWPALPNGKHDTAKGRDGLVAPIAWGADGWPVLGNGSSVTTPIGWP